MVDNKACVSPKIPNSMEIGPSCKNWCCQVSIWSNVSFLFDIPAFWLALKAKVFISIWCTQISYTLNCIFKIFCYLWNPMLTGQMAQVSTSWFIFWNINPWKNRLSSSIPNWWNITNLKYICSSHIMFRTIC